MDSVQHNVCNRDVLWSLYIWQRYVHYGEQMLQEMNYVLEY